MLHSVVDLVTGDEDGKVVCAPGRFRKGGREGDGAVEREH